MKRYIGPVMILAWLALAYLSLSAAENRPVDRPARLDPRLWTAPAAVEQDAILWLDEQADLSGVPLPADKVARGRAVMTRLQAAAAGQAPLLAWLDNAGVAYRSYWIANMVWVRAPRDLLVDLANRPEIAYIYADATSTLAPPPPGSPPDTAVAGIEPNISLVNAPQLWTQGYRGQGVVIGGQDTGYDWDHPALINAYRGWNGASANHNYNWHDAIHSGGSADCPANSPVPCDDYSQGHGSHTMGTMVGDDGGANQIGMAPDARWIGCRNMDQGVGQVSTYSECFQWFVAPTDLNDNNPDPALAPDVISNSWYCDASEGCTDPLVLATVVANVRAAGIVVVVAAGNSGPGCDTIDYPPAIYADSFTIGATDLADNIASFSSRGPAPAGIDTSFKPDITAPGVNIRSSSRFGGYYFASGTSMATPHVAGSIALLLSAQPELAGNVDYLETILRSTAVPLTSGQNCGGVGGDEIPNHTFGYGRLDAWAALNDAPYQLDLAATAPPSVRAGDLLVYTISARWWHTLDMGHQLVLTDVVPAGTTFVTASPAYSLDGSTITWSGPTLAPGDSFSATLTVQVDFNASGVIVNDGLLAQIDEIDGPIYADPVATIVVSDYSYLPIILRP